MDYSKTGLRSFLVNGHGLTTRKTVTTLTAIDRLLHDYLEDGPVLVIAPKRVAENTWSKEAAKWEHLRHLRVSRIMGTARERLAVSATSPTTERPTPSVSTTRSPTRRRRTATAWWASSPSTVTTSPTPTPVRAGARCTGRDTARRLSAR